ncbi:IS701 family transposase [Salinibacter ruber]|uniref:IS701 family transposase n=1 Tax=Salinibacter ruber TaxID=146919 RepID=UPI002072CC52|nr:IS701 family transposase [Salinibacter ruber]
MIETALAWNQELTKLHGRIAPRFARSEPRERALRYLRGLLSEVKRKNGWQMAEALGEATPYGTQRLLNGSRWEADAVRDDLRTYAVGHLGSDEGVLIIDETGFIKKGTESVGVKRQYSGTAGKVENCQIGVFLCQASEEGAAFLDRKLYLPKEWATDMERRRKAGVPEEVEFATKPELARQMLERAFDEGVPRCWAAGDSVYGSSRPLRQWLERQKQPFVLAVPSNESLWSGPIWEEGQVQTAAEIADSLPSGAFQRLSAGKGSKGERLYDWALTPLWRLQLTAEEQGWSHALLVRRSTEDPEEKAYYVVFAPREKASLETVVRVAGMRWRIEEGFEQAKDVCGLDEYEVRKYEAFHRHITLSLLAHAFLSVVAARERKKGIQKKGIHQAARPLKTR